MTEGPDSAPVSRRNPARPASSFAPAAPIPPGATVGILGGGQLGRMLGLAARAMGYAVAVLDPDAGCPAAAVAGRVVSAEYDSVGGALELARGCAVVTYELEHVDAAMVDAIEAAGVPVRPGVRALRTTQDRLAERRFLAGLGIATAPGREVADIAGLHAAAAELGTPLRLKAPIGGYDGRSQVRVATVADAGTALDRLGRPPGTPLLAERELEFEAELSVITARALEGTTAAFPIALNRHDDGILAESVAPAPVADTVADAARSIGAQVAESLDVVGLVTVELFLLRDGSLVVNELAPRVHNSGHWTIEGARTSQFEQQVRAICGLPLGAPAALGPTAMANLLGSGEPRPARLIGVEAALADPLVHLHVYDKRTVFERRKMGHVTVAGAPSLDEAIARARRARDALAWA